MRRAAAVAVALLLGFAAAPASGAVQVRAQLSRSRIPLDEASALEVVVRGALTGLQQPEFGLPDGLEVLGTSRQESVQIGDGGVQRQVVFRYELGAQQPGRYTVGPIKVEVGGTSYLSGAVILEVLAGVPEAPATGGSGRDVVSLRTEVQPARAWVGQELLLTVRLVQRAMLAQDPEYQPPSTPGFWGDRASAPESYYADSRGARVLVTETRTRLYPLTAGRLTIGPAAALVVLRPEGGGDSFGDPFAFLRGRGSGRPVELRSESLRVHVQPLPSPPPAGFLGAVGMFEVSWSSDRRHLAQDAPFTVILELRGSGNLPLMRTPAWQPADCEIYASQSDDSLARPGTHEPGRKRFNWTLLARRTGRIVLEPPEVAWFDPAEGRYHSASLAPIVLEVSPPALAREGPNEGYPRALLAHPAAPRARGPQAWAWVLAGALLGVAWRIFRRAAAAAPDAADRARAAAWRRALAGRVRGPDWWRTAEEAVTWLGDRGRLVHHLRQKISSARYGGETAQEEEIRSRLLDHLEQAVGAAPARWPARLLALGLVAAAVILAWGFGPRGADPRLEAQARQAEEWARRGDWERARRGWEALWRQSHDAGLAARLAWAVAQSGDAGPATFWVMRGLESDPREPALRWVMQRTRENGGLVGAVGSTWWFGAWEAALLGWMAGLGGALAWGRRAVVAACGTLALIAALLLPAWSWRRAVVMRGVVMREAALIGHGGEPLTLEPGQVVEVLKEQGDRLRVRPGRGVEGEVERAAVARLAR